MYVSFIFITKLTINSFTPALTLSYSLDAGWQNDEL